MIYLDNSATTAVNNEVMDTFMRVNEKFWGNPNSLHSFGALAEQVLIKSSRQVLDLLNANNHQAIFTSGATESNNLAIKGVAMEYKSRGNHIITTKIEHPSVYEVCKDLESKGFEITYLDVSLPSEQIVKQLEEQITSETILVSCMHVNSEMGLVLPIEELGNVVKQYPKIKFHVDAVQSIGKLDVNVDAMNIDLLSISAHKIHGTKGVGALIVRRNLKLTPQTLGGGQMDGLRSGTVNVAGSAMLARAMRLLIENIEENSKRIQLLYDYTMKKLVDIDGLTCNNVFDNQSPYIINFWLKGIKGETLVHALASHEIYISAKSACSSKTKKASAVLLALGIDEVAATESVRVSFSHLSTLEEVDVFLKALKEAVVSINSNS